MDFRCNLVKSIELSLFGPTNLLIDDMYIYIFSLVYTHLQYYKFVFNYSQLEFITYLCYTLLYDELFNDIIPGNAEFSKYTYHVWIINLI